MLRIISNLPVRNQYIYIKFGKKKFLNFWQNKMYCISAKLNLMHEQKHLNLNIWQIFFIKYWRAPAAMNTSYKQLPTLCIYYIVEMRSHIPEFCKTTLQHSVHKILTPLSQNIDVTLI